MTVKNLYQVRQLGDRHNFEKTTYLRSDGKVVKQRNTSWERAFLCAHSPLRQHIDAICSGAGMHAPLPDLYYNAADEGGSIVDYLHLNAPGILQAKDTESIGVLLALSLWFGWSDISAENIVLGRKNDDLVLCPVDLETVLIPHSRLAETVLKPAGDANDMSGGLWTIRSQLRTMANSDAPAIIVGAFSSILSLLHQNKFELSLLVNALINEPIRIKIMSSDFYRNVLSSSKPSILSRDLMEEEIRQLNRGEIPYFFSFAGQEQLFWFDSSESFKVVKHLRNSRSIRFPKWSHTETKEDLAQLVKLGVQDIVNYFWNDKQLNASHSGTEISTDEHGIIVKSTGHYVPLRSN